MSSSFDPYAEWLSIVDPQRPPNHYRLIGIEPLADDPQAISDAADAALASLRKVGASANSQLWQKVFDELTLAKLTLTNPLRKLQYDAQLRTRLAQSATTVATSQVSAPPQAAVRPQMPAQGTSGARTTWPVDSNLFPPGAAPVVAAAARVAAPASGPAPQAPPVGSAQPLANYAMPPLQNTPNVAAPIAAPPVSVPYVQSYAAPPVYAAPQTYPGQAGVPVAQSAAPQFSQAPMARPVVAAAPQTYPAHPIETVSMPPLGARPQPAGPSRAPAAAPIPEASLFNPEPAVVSIGAAASSTAAATRTSAKLSPTLTPVAQQPGGTFELPDYLSKKPQKAQNGLFIGGVAAVALVVIAGIVLSSGRGKRPADDAPSVAQLPPAPVRPVVPANPTEDDEFATQNNTPAHDNNERPAQPPKVSAKPKPEGQAEPVVEVDPVMDADDSQPEPETPDEPAVAVKPAKQPPATTPTEPPAAPADEAKPAADPQQAAAFAKSVKQVRAALGARNVPKAKQEVETAVAAAVTIPQREQAERLRLLTGYVDEFWTNVGKALKDLQATDELKIGTTTVAVVDSDPTSLTVHVAGMNKSYKLAEMPTGLVIVLADRWFDAKNPTTKVFYGAFYAADAKGDPKEAKRLWEEANLAGASTADLLPLLEDGVPVLLAEQGPVPDAKQLAAAEKTFKAAYQQELRTAKSPQRKLELAKKFVDVALTTDDPAERYVLFLEGYEIASEAGNAPGIVRAVDEMAKWYKVDAIELKTTALAKAGSSTSNSLVAKAVARTALEVLDQALADKRLDHAGKLSKAALTAAKKSKDAALVKQATEREQQVREMTKDKPASDSAG